MKIVRSTLLVLVASAILAPAAAAQDDAAQDDPEAVVREAYGLLSLDPDEPIDLEAFDQYFMDDAVVGFGTSMLEFVIMPVEEFIDDFSRGIRDGEIGGVGQAMIVDDVECFAGDQVAECFVRYRLVRPEMADEAGGQTVELTFIEGRWLIQSVSWVVDPEEGMLLEPDVSVAIQSIPTAARGFRPTPERTWDRVFPILGERMVRKGIKLPLPLGLGFVGTWKRMDVLLSNLEIAINGGERRSAELLDWGRVIATSWTAQAKFDVWLLPFLNFYGLFGRVDGETEIPFSFVGGELLEHVGAGDLCEGLRPPGYCFTTYSTTVYPPIGGWNFVVGLNPALGYKNFVVTVPTSMTWTDLDSQRWVRSFYLSPRLGLNVPTTGAGALTVFIGAAYLNADNYIEGEVTLPTDLPINGGLITVEYFVESGNADRWNYLVGFNWSLSERWSIHAEADAGGSRQGATASVNWRF